VLFFDSAGYAKTMAVMRMPSRVARVWCAAAVLAVLATNLQLTARADNLERAGPWAFAERINESTHAREQIALTPAAEDSDIWLLLACTESRFTASLMDNAGFSYAVGSRSTLILRTEDFPVVSVVAKSIQKKQLTIDAAISRHIMPLFLQSGKIVISINEAGNTAHDYTFPLQPNNLSLAKIVRDCWIEN